MLDFFLILFFFTCSIFSVDSKYFLKNLRLCLLFSNCLTDKKQIDFRLNKGYFRFNYAVFLVVRINFIC
jgi:hypothetical protein